jgi:hypothetical protein
MKSGFAHGGAPCAVLEHIGGGDEEEMLGLLDARRVLHPAEAQIDVLHQIGDIGLDGHTPLEKAMERLTIALRQPRQNLPAPIGLGQGALGPSALGHGGKRGFLAVHAAFWAPETAICQALCIRRVREILGEFGAWRGGRAWPHR